MVKKKECKRCHTLVIDIYDGYCALCWDEIQNELLLENIVQTKLPEGLVAFWVDTVSYISKKKNQKYFKIPDTEKSSIIDNKKYRIIIKEL